MSGKALHPTCYHHNTRVPSWLKGKNWRVPKCEMCDAKVARGEVTEDAPRPEVVFRAHLAELREKGQRPEAYARRKKARAAMTAAYLSAQPAPGRV